MFAKFFKRPAAGAGVKDAAEASEQPPAMAPESEVGLGPAFGERVDWPADMDGGREMAALAPLQIFDLWKTIPGGHKWLHYFPAYEKVFAARRHQPLRVLEIGVYRGASLKLWREYFTHPDSVIIGVDIDPACAAFGDTGRNMHVRIGSQADAGFLGDVVREFGPFDIIIDDGSHISSHMIASFNALFLDGLVDPGIYLVEDTHANYWTGYRDSELSFIDLARQLVETMHYPYMQTANIQSFALRWQGRLSAMSVPLITTLVDEVRFFDSIVVISKQRRAHLPMVYHMER